MFLKLLQIDESYNSPELSSINWEKLAQEYRDRKVAESRGYYQSKPLGYPKIPTDLQLRDYQQTAIISWFRNKGRGTLKMATGSGKTIVALAIATELYQKNWFAGSF